MNKKTLDYIRLLSYDGKFKSAIFEKIIQNANICILDQGLEIGIQQYEGYLDYKPLNQACTLEDYESLISLVKPKDLIHYRMFLEDFTKLWEFDFSFVNEECVGDVYLFPVNITFFDIEKTKFFVRSKHAAFLLIDTHTKKAFYIDPDDSRPSDTNAKYDEKDFKKYLKKKLNVWLEHLLGYKIKLDLLNVRAPQYVTDDVYCLFWSFYLAEEILKQYDGSKELHPKKIIQEIRKKYRKKEELQHMIKNFIQKIIKSK